MKKRGLPLFFPFLYRLQKLSQQVQCSQSQVLPTWDGGEFAVHSVAVVLAIRHTAGDAGIHIVHTVFPPYAMEYMQFLRKYRNPIDKDEKGL